MTTRIVSVRHLLTLLCVLSLGLFATVGCESEAPTAPGSSLQKATHGPTAEPKPAPGGGAGVAAGVTAGVKVVEGVAKIIEQQSDDIQAAASATVVGCECGAITKTDQDQGSFTAEADAEVKNACGHAKGEASASEGLFGSTISGYSVSYKVSAKATPNPECPNEVAAAAAAGVDGKILTGSVAQKGLVSTGPTPIIAYVDLAGFSLTSSSQSNDYASWNGTYTVDGAVVFDASISMDSAGNVSSSGDIPSSSISTSYNRQLKKWTLTVADQSFETQIGTQLGIDQTWDVAFNGSADGFSY